jgi:hypothetical protein
MANFEEFLGSFISSVHSVQNWLKNANKVTLKEWEGLRKEKKINYLVVYELFTFAFLKDLNPGIRAIDPDYFRVLPDHSFKLLNSKAVYLSEFYFERDKRYLKIGKSIFGPIEEEEDLEKKFIFWEEVFKCLKDVKRKEASLIFCCKPRDLMGLVFEFEQFSRFLNIDYNSYYFRKNRALSKLKKASLKFLEG